MEIEVKAILYVPGRIASGVCFPDPQRLRVKNQCPHLTLKVGSWAPVQSNSLLEAVFIDSDEQHPAPLSKEYQDGSVANAPGPEVRLIKNVHIEGQGEFDVYYIKLA